MAREALGPFAVSVIGGDSTQPSSGRATIDGEELVLISRVESTRYPLADLLVVSPLPATGGKPTFVLEPRGSGIRIVFELADAKRIANRMPMRIRDAIHEAAEHARPLLHIVTHGVVLVVVVLGSLALLVRGGTALGRTLLMRCPPSWEARLGDLAYTMEHAAHASTDPLLNSTVETIAEPLIRAFQGTEYRITIHVVNSPEVNAFAYPGGQVVVYTGFLADAESPEEVAGVLAHELSHVRFRHGLENLGNRLGIATLFSVVLGISNDSALGRLAPDLLALSYSRGQEEQADREGVELLHRAKIPVRGLVSFFARLAAKESRLERALSFASTHPSSDERAAYLRSLTEAAEGEVPYHLDWPAVRAAAQRAR